MTMGVSMPRMSRIIRPGMVAGAAVVLLLVSGCSGESEADAQSPAASPTTVIVDGVEYGPTIEGMPTLKELASDERGEWRKTTILPDDPAFTFEPSVITEAAGSVWSEADIKEAQRLAVEMAVDMIDTAANGAPGDGQARVDWWELNMDKFDPVWQQEIYNSLISDDPNLAVVFKGTHREASDTSDGYGLVYGEGEVHIKDRAIETTAIDAGPIGDENGISVALDIDYVNVAEVNGKKTDEEVEGKLIYHFTKSEDGQLRISGVQPEFRYQILN